MNSKIIILSPNHYSLYSLCVAEELRRRGFTISGIICVRLINWARFLRESRRDGLLRILKKFWKKAVVKERTFQRRDYESLNDRKKSLGLREKSLRIWAKSHDIPFIFCEAFDDPAVLEKLSLWRPNLGVFTGGGLVRMPFIQQLKWGLVNCHAGILPHYRGMNVVEWPVLDGRKDLVGITTHLMDAGIDTGPILRTKPISFRKGESCREIRERFPALMVDHMVESVSDLLKGDLVPQAQSLHEGRQYFVMHPRFLELSERLSRRN